MDAGGTNCQSIYTPACMLTFSFAGARARIDHHAIMHDGLAHGRSRQTGRQASRVGGRGGSKGREGGLIMDLSLLVGAGVDCAKVHTPPTSPQERK